MCRNNTGKVITVIGKLLGDGHILRTETLTIPEVIITSVKMEISTIIKKSDLLVSINHILGQIRTHK